MLPHPAEKKQLKLGLDTAGSEPLLVQAGWSAYTQLYKVHDQLSPADWPAHTKLDQLMMSFTSSVFKLVKLA